MKYSYIGKLVAKEGQGETLLNILLEASKLVSNAKGCQLYLVGKKPGHDDVVQIVELWDTKEDHDNSLKNDNVKALIGKAIPILAEPPQSGMEIEIIGGKGF